MNSIKFIVGSITDVITNSSSEVFVMYQGDAEYYDNLDTNGCVRIKEITWDFLRENGNCNWWMVFDICGIDKNILKEYIDKTDYINDYYYEIDTEDWDAFLELYHDIIQEKLIGLYWVEITDHFVDAEEVNKSARRDSIWMESRH